MRTRERGLDLYCIFVDVLYGNPRSRGHSNLMFIARQHAIHGVRDSVTANLSVHPSICTSQSGIVSKTIRQTLSTTWQGQSLFVRYRRHKIPKDTPSA